VDRPEITRCVTKLEATPGIEIHEVRHSISRLASNSQSITQLQRPASRLSSVSPLSVNGVVPNPYQGPTTRNWQLWERRTTISVQRRRTSCSLMVVLSPTPSVSNIYQLLDCIHSLRRTAYTRVSKRSPFELLHACTNRPSWR
jgi:hypothetical protein